MEMFMHVGQHAGDWPAIEDLLGVLVQRIQAIWASHFDFLSLLKHLEQPIDLFWG